MKKYFLYAFAALAMFSCSDDDDVAPVSNGGNENVPVAEGPQRIRLGIINNLQTTRGTGSVGDTINSNENLWNSDTLHVVMFKKNTLELAYEDDGDDAVFNYQTMIAPSAVDSAQALCADGTFKYFPSAGNYDFWGMHLDDAVEYTGGIPVTYVEGDSVKAAIKINGTQDIMVATTVDSTDVIKSKVPQLDRLYSAYSARRGVQPSLNFRHLLTRLRFTALQGNPIDSTKSGPVAITNITATSLNSANVILAYKKINTADPENPDTINLDRDALISYPALEGDTVLFSLMKDTASVGAPARLLAPFYTEEANVRTSDSISLTDKKQQIGVPMLVADMYEYTITVYTEQNVAKRDFSATGKTFDKIIADADPTEWAEYVKTIEGQQSFTIKIADGEKFKKGYSYNVNITTYGAQEITLGVELEAWERGGDLNFDPDMDENSAFYVVPADLTTAP